MNGETVRLERRFNLVPYVVLMVYFFYRFQENFGPTWNGIPGVAPSLAAMILISLTYARTRFVITDRRVIMNLDFFIFRLRKWIPVENVVCVGRMDIPLAEKLLGRNVGMIIFYGSGALSLVFFPLVTDPAGIEEVFERARPGAVPDEPVPAAPEDAAEKITVDKKPHVHATETPEPSREEREPQMTGEEKPAVTCPECGAGVPRGLKFCRKCGTKI
ncbi:MAG: zinc ribbon domain-containing protein [bacterium]